MPVASVSPETDARHLHDLASSTAARLLGFVAQIKKPVFRRRLRPRSRSGRHSYRPARAPVPAGLHRRPPHGPSATAPPWQLTVDTRRPCTCNQRSSTRSHHTFDNSLITARRRYSTFLNFDHVFIGNFQGRGIASRSLVRLSVSTSAASPSSATTSRRRGCLHHRAFIY